MNKTVLDFDIKIRFLFKKILLPKKSFENLKSCPFDSRGNKVSNDFPKCICGIRTQLYWPDLLESHRHLLQTNLREKYVCRKNWNWSLIFNRITRNVSLYPLVLLASLMASFSSKFVAEMAISSFWHIFYNFSNP